MTKYVKKPIPVEAVAVESDDRYALPEWAQVAWATGKLIFTENGFLVETLEGTHTASYGDYLVRGIRKELYPVKKAIFEETYEPVAD